MEKNEIVELQKISKEARINVLKMTTIAGSGHIGGALGIADVMTYLYFKELNIKKVEKHFDESIQRDSCLNDDRDRFVLSAGHMVPILYSMLIARGFIDESLLNSLRDLESLLQGHTTINLEIGVETTGGSLGQGVGIACGFALSNKIYRKSGRVYCILGDGELNEGSVWEAIMFGAKYKLDNLVFILDRNNIQQTNFGDEVMPLDPVADKFKAFNWETIEINGNDFNEIENAFEKAKGIKKKPSIIVANTIPGKGVSFLENDYIWHSKVLNNEQLTLAIEELNA